MSFWEKDMSQLCHLYYNIISFLWCGFLMCNLSGNDAYYISDLCVFSYLQLIYYSPLAELSRYINFYGGSIQHLFV